MPGLERCLSYREENKGVRKAGANSGCLFYRVVLLIEVSVKNRESTTGYKSKEMSFLSYHPSQI